MDRVEERAETARHYLAILRLVAEHYFNSSDIGSHALDILLIFAIFLGQAEGRRMTCSDLSHFLGTPRITLRRRVNQFEAMRIARRVRVGSRLEIELTTAEERVFLDPLFREFARHRAVMINMDTTGLEKDEDVI